MKSPLVLTATIAVFAASAYAAGAVEDNPQHKPHHRHHEHHQHHAAGWTRPLGPSSQPAPAVIRPVRPPPVQNDSDGMSRDPEDCNMGCLDNTP
jgi:hypothetical protein